MKREQFIARRDRNLNTSSQFARSITASVLAHCAGIFLVALVSVMGHKKNAIVPGYKVSLVSIPKPTTLERKTVEKKPKAPKSKPKKKKSVRLKKSPTNVKIKKSKLKIKKKLVPTGKKIIAKKKEKAEPAKKKNKIDEPKKTVTKPISPEPSQKKAVVAEGVPFPHIWYLKVVERKVDENWITHGLDITGRRTDPTIRFSIARDGSLSSVTMELSSGSAQLDSSAIEAVKNASPFPPLPDDFPSNTLDVHFGFSYDQHE